MLTTRIRPRFCDTDALGHISNTVIPVWFVEARETLYQWFAPEPGMPRGAVAVVRLEVDYLAETRFGDDVEVRTFIEHVGNSSFRMLQELWQGDTLTARGRTTLVNFDRENRRSIPLPDHVRQEMSKHLLSREER